MLTLVKIVIGVLAVTSDRGFLESGAGRWLGTSNKPSHGLQCYTDVAATEITVCKENEGFRTCFTKYNDSKFRPPAKPKGEVPEYEEGQVTGRGCSTKDKVFYKECETHSYGDQVEKMCFCSFFLCNGGAQSSRTPNIALTILAATLVLAVTASSKWDHTANTSAFPDDQSTRHEPGLSSSKAEKTRTKKKYCDTEFRCLVSFKKNDLCFSLQCADLQRTTGDSNSQNSLNCVT